MNLINLNSKKLKAYILYRFIMQYNNLTSIYDYYMCNPPTTLIDSILYIIMHKKPLFRNVCHKGVIKRIQCISNLLLNKSTSIFELDKEDVNNVIVKFIEDYDSKCFDNYRLEITPIIKYSNEENCKECKDLFLISYDKEKGYTPLI